jgi:hypothetical protein
MTRPECIESIASHRDANDVARSTVHRGRHRGSSNTASRVVLRVATDVLIDRRRIDSFAHRGQLDIHPRVLSQSIEQRFVDGAYHEQDRSKQRRIRSVCRESILRITARFASVTHGNASTATATVMEASLGHAPCRRTPHAPWAALEVALRALISRGERLQEPRSWLR